MHPASGTALYNVFATWCGPCREETPMLAAASRRLIAHGVHVVGIDQGESPAAVRAFAYRFGLSYPILIDDDNSTNALLGARVIPETVLVRNGVVSEIYVGPLSGQGLAKLVGMR